MATNTQSSTQTSNGIVVPRLNIPPRTTHTTPSQASPNRYTTVVYVDYVIHDTVRFVKWFSDIQTAWIWIRGQVNQHENREEWDVTPFLAVANGMENEWRHNRGITVAICNEYEYCAYFEPSVNYNDVHGHEEYF